MAAKRPIVELVPAVPESPTEELPRADDRPAIGSWWWVDDSADTSHKPTEYDEPGRKYIGCVTELGSNYAKLEGVRFNDRIALDDFHKLCAFEPNPGAYFDTKIGFHKTEVRKLTSEIQKLCRELGVPMYQALAVVDEPSQALAVVHGTADVNRYEKALVKAKEKTLPELYKLIQKQHELMSTWMRAEMIPAQADLEHAKQATAVIGHKIHTVELYAGLQEKLVQVRKGKPAPNDTKVHVMQRRHYMDEECLIRYEAGGMSFDDIEAFDKWLARDDNMFRLLPHDRTILAFRIRKFTRQWGDGEFSVESFISLMHEEKENKRTFLYIRNGRQLWRLSTSVDFEAELFPSREDSDLLGDDSLWVRKDGSEGWGHTPLLITGRRHAAWIESWKKEKARHERELAQWKAAGKPNGEWSRKLEPDDPNFGRMQIRVVGGGNERRPAPGYWLEDGKPEESGNLRDPDYKRYKLLTPHSIYYDDAIKQIRTYAFEQNRIAIIVQGLLDRSLCLHPHPPWRIFTPEGFAAGIELVYDVSRALNPSSSPPSWENYRAQLNKSIKVGAYTIGQYRAWKVETERRDGRDSSHWEFRERHGDGPDVIAEVIKVRADGACLFRWTRARLRGVWRPHPTKPGWRQRQWPEIEMSWWCPREHLTCVSAYTPNDFRMFFDDPRTREQYLKWAPILLRSEDWHAERVITEGQANRKKKRRRDPTKPRRMGDDDDE